MSGSEAAHTRSSRRGSIESIQAYLQAGSLLSEARGECRRGEWGAVLDRAGVAERTAQRMMQAWRLADEAGADAEAVHDAGGIREFVTAAVMEAGGVLPAVGKPDGGDMGGEKPVLGSGFEPPHGPDTPGSDRGISALPHSRADSPGRGDTGVIGNDWRDGRPPAPPGHGITQAPFDDGLTAAQRARQAKRDRGECIDCTRPTDGWHVRCPACRARIAATDKRRRENAKLGAVLGKRIRDAARHGRGIRLTAADVAGLVAGGRRR